MHVADVSKGILGANGIVGAGLSIATGAAFGALLDRNGLDRNGLDRNGLDRNGLDRDEKVSARFFGDGASNQGALMETLNIASLWQLPVIFVCENNGFSEFTPAAQVTSGRITDRARAFGVPAADVDGNNVTEVWRAAGEAVARARAGGGPSFIEARTYRIQGHFESESFVLGGGSYRDDHEIDKWREADPVSRFRSVLLDTGTTDEAALGRIESAVAARVAEAVAFAEAASGRPGARRDPHVRPRGRLRRGPHPAPASHQRRHRRGDGARREGRRLRRGR